MTREYIAHPGAVAIAAVDDQDRVLLVRQYRHPVRRCSCGSCRPGCCDVAGEPLEVTAARELWEETAPPRPTGYELLLDALLSPGSSSERLLLFLARDVTPADGDAARGEGEEAGMEAAWVASGRVLDGVLAGRLPQPVAGVGALALAERRRRQA